MAKPSRYDNRTLTDCTDTAEGIVPHVPIPGGMAPVRLCMSLRNSAGLPYPQRDIMGRLVYALPGGGVFTP